MKNNRYKVFFTITFFYSIDQKKTITKFFKSDVDIDTITLGIKLSDDNVYKKWQNYAIKVSLTELNSPENFIEANVSDKKLVTHRIINLNNLMEVF